MSLQDEIKQIAKEEAEKNKVEFPDVQKVEVTNFPEQKEPVVNVSVPEVKVPNVNIPAPIVNIEAPQVTVEKPDLSDIAKGLADLSDKFNQLVEKPNTEFDYERFEKIAKENKSTYKGGGIGPSKQYVMDEQGKSISPVGRDIICSGNSSTTPLDDTDVFTGDWVDTYGYTGVKVAVKTDQNGTYTVQWSPDGTNADSTLTRYYRTSQIEAPHKFENMRRYMRVTFTNNSGSDQTYLRLQTILTNSPGILNAPLDGTLSQDYDAISVRPSDFHTEVALNRRQGSTTWNKFGYNLDVDVGTEVVASWGGTFTPLTTATTLTIASTSTADDGDPAGTGGNSVVVYGLDANEDEQIEVVTLNGTTNVVTTSTWLGINRVAMFLCGSGQVNAGTINITATTGGSTMAQMPAGEGVTQQCIFHIPKDHQFLVEFLKINTLKQAAQNPRVTVKMWVYSRVSNGKQEVYKVDIDTSVTNDVSESLRLPFPISERTVVWLEATTDKADTIVNARFSGELERDADA